MLKYEIIFDETHGLLLMQEHIQDKTLLQLPWRLLILILQNLKFTHVKFLLRTRKRWQCKLDWGVHYIIMRVHSEFSLVYSRALLFIVHTQRWRHLSKLFPRVFALLILTFLLCKTIRFHLFVILYCNGSQKTSWHAKNKKSRHSTSSSAVLFCCLHVRHHPWSIKVRIHAWSLLVRRQKELDTVWNPKMRTEMFTQSSVLLKT